MNALLRKPVPLLTARHPVTERHSRFVDHMKILLPAIAAVFLCLLLLWPWMNDRASGLPFDILPFDYRNADTSTIVNPRFLGSDKNDDPFIVTARAATNLPDDNGWMMLETPKAELSQQAGHWISLESETGFVSRDENLISLESDVFLYRDDGVEFRTDGAVIDMNDNRAFGDRPVAGGGRDFTVSSEGGFAVEQGGTIIRFLGKSRLTLPQAARPSSQEATPR